MLSYHLGPVALFHLKRNVLSARGGSGLRQEAIDLQRAVDVDQPEVTILGAAQPLAVGSGPPALRPYEVEHQRVPREEGRTEAFALYSPERLAAAHPGQGSAHCPGEHQRKWQIEPYDRVRARPNDVPRLPVAAVHDPGRALRRLVNTSAELFEWRKLPVRVRPVELIHLHARKAEPRRQRSADGRLAGSTRTDDRDPPHGSDDGV